jgi:hypothetical protein
VPRESSIPSRLQSLEAQKKSNIDSLALVFVCLLREGQVGRLTRAESLNIHDSSLSDSGLVHLKGLTNLRVVLLYRTQVSDAGLVHLKGLTNLSFLQLDGTRVTDVGVEELQRALPGLRIIR